jgi:hypothetical protein
MKLIDKCVKVKRYDCVIVFYITSQVKWFLLANGGYN